MKNATATIKLTKKWINRDHIHTFARLEIILITSFKVHEYSWALHFLLSPYYEHGRWDPSHRSEGKMVRQSSPTVRFWGKYISIHWHIYQEKSQILTLFKSFQGISCLVLLVSFSAGLILSQIFTKFSRHFLSNNTYVEKSGLSLGKTENLAQSHQQKSQYRRNLLCAKYPMDYNKIANR